MSWHLFTAALAAVAFRYKPETVKLAPAPTPVFVAASPDMIEMKPSPIEPSWVIAGDPQARAGAHSKADDQFAATGVWDCTAGTFRWYFGWDETVVILEGQVLVTAADGTQRLLTAGDIAYFKGGTWATWHIDSYLRKIAFLRKPFPAPISKLYRLKNALRPKPTVGLVA